MKYIIKAAYASGRIETHVTTSLKEHEAKIKMLELLPTVKYITTEEEKK